MLTGRTVQKTPTNQVKTPGENGEPTDIGLVIGTKGTSYKSIKGSSVKLNNGKKYKLRVAAVPKGKVTYKIGNKKVIKVSTTKKDNVLQIKALKKGSTTLTIKANGMKRKIKVRVKK